MSTIQLTSTLTCLNCGHQSVETMPIDAYQYFYDRAGCGTLLKPARGDCCVFCSYGSVPCPLVQETRRVGRPAACCGAEDRG